MKTNSGCSFVAIVVLCALALSFGARAQVYEELYSFSSVPPDGGVPHGGVVEAPDGNFYGTTFYGGTWDYGTVFRMTPSGVVTVIASLNGTTTDQHPNTTMVKASSGDLYGATVVPSRIFRAATDGTITILGSGSGTIYGLVEGTDGYLYGVDQGNYDWNGGAIFSFRPDTSQSGIYYQFQYSRPQNGYRPSGGLLQARDGNLYGVTQQGGEYGYGVVYRITTNGTYTTMCSFKYGEEAGYPYGRLLQASDGNFYGVAGNGSGTIFKMTPSGTLTTVAWFDGYAGEYPNGGLIEANDGCFYGTSPHAGTNIGALGTVFKMTPDGKLTGLFSFTGNSGPYPGSNPYAGLVQGSDGNLYGTSGGLGTRGAGNVFRIIMPGPQLALTNVAGQAILSWRTNYTGFNLQTSMDLEAGNWTELTNAPAIATGRFWVTNTPSGSPQFFRLKK